MSLISNNNVTPNETLSRSDLLKVLRDEIGEVRAEFIDEKRQKSKEALDNPDAAAKAAADAATAKRKAHGMAMDAAGAGTIANIRRSFSDPLADMEPGEMDRTQRARMFARWVQCAFQARQAGGGVDLALDIARRAGQNTLVKAMQAQDFDNGGFMLEPMFADAVIEELLARSVYMRAGPENLDLPEGGMVLPYESDGADAQWAGEGTAVNAEEVTGGQIRMQPHKLITIVGVSNDLLRAKPGKSDTFVLNSILRGMRTKLDSTLLRSLGTANEPIGLRGHVAAANQFDVTSKASITQAVLVRELLNLQNLIETANVDLAVDRPHQFTSPRIKNYLKSQRATDGLLFPGLEAPAASQELLGIPLSVTTNIPTNLDESGTAANDESEMYCVALAHMVLGKTEDMIVDVSPGGAYTDSSGTTQAGFSRDETPVRVIGKWDHAAQQRGNEISMAQELDWTL